MSGYVMQQIRLLRKITGLESLQHIPICARCGVGRKLARRMGIPCLYVGWIMPRRTRHIWDWKLAAEGD